MAAVVGVRFKNAGKLYYFDPGSLWPVPGTFVIVETARGLEYGQVITGVREISDDNLAAPIKTVVRIATERDAQHDRDNAAFRDEAFAICQQKIDEHKLDMKLVGVEQTFDNAKILFYFTANGRVDFRALVKDLASVFHTRIELRQIGVRDEAKMLGGLGPCGRPVCCGAFLGDFQPVSIKMAKEQNLSLNPTKISGVCGRLMCCLKFEEDHYELMHKTMPRQGREIETPDGLGVVVDVNVLKETVTVRVRKGDTSELKTFTLEEIKWNRAAQATSAPRPAAPRPQRNAPEAEWANAGRSESSANKAEPSVNRMDSPRPARAANRNAALVKAQETPDRKPAQPVPPTPQVSAWQQAVDSALEEAEKGK